MLLALELLGPLSSAEKGHARESPHGCLAHVRPSVHQSAKIKKRVPKTLGKLSPRLRILPHLDSLPRVTHTPTHEVVTVVGCSHDNNNTQKINNNTRFSACIRVYPYTKSLLPRSPSLVDNTTQLIQRNEMGLAWHPPDLGVFG